MIKASLFGALAATLLVSTNSVTADSSSPRLAGYYDDFIAICDGKAFEWRPGDQPRPSLNGVKQVATGRHNRYALTHGDQLLSWSDDPSQTTTLMNNVKSLHAGRSGLLVIREDDSLWEITTKSALGFGEKPVDDAVKIADRVLTAAVGDSANYYVTLDGALFVRGLAHRGQYGDGKLKASEDYLQTAAGVVQVVAHTGHALLLKSDGSVWGTGGNIYGPLGRHGFGDKAISWGPVFDGAISIATGSSHSVAIKRDRSLWIWGRNLGLEPRQVMADVIAVAAGNRGTIALSKGGLWHWDTVNKPQLLMTCR